MNFAGEKGARKGWSKRQDQDQTSSWECSIGGREEGKVGKDTKCGNVLTLCLPATLTNPDSAPRLSMIEEGRRKPDVEVITGWKAKRKTKESSSSSSTTAAAAAVVVVVEEKECGWDGRPSRVCVVVLIEVEGQHGAKKGQGERDYDILSRPLAVSGGNIRKRTEK